jgi:molybdopterin-biosynthesis enzyme MoeA-like protein
VVILPGIPSILRHIVSDRVDPQLLAGRGRPEHIVEITHAYPESWLNPVLHRLVAELPDVHVGSYAGRECVIRLRGPREPVEEAAALVRAALDELGALPGSARVRAAWRSHWTPEET